MSDLALLLIHLLELVVSLTGMSILFGGSALWFVIATRWRRGTIIVPFEPRRVVPWGFLDLFVGVVLLVVVVAFATAFAEQVFGWRIAPEEELSVQDKLPHMLLFSLATLATSAAMAIIIMLRTGCAPRDLGWSWRKVPQDVLLGMQAFLVLALPTFAIQFVMVQFWPSEHPLVEALQKQPDGKYIAMAIFMAVVSAPLAEEFFFRVLFQGWVEKLFDPIAAHRPNFGTSLFVGERVHSHEPAPLSEIPTVSSPDDAHGEPIVLAEVVEPPTFTLADVFPPIISATVFALMHWSHGPDWVALLVLALGLGYLYRRTHRILPGIIVHFLLNALSMASLLLKIFPAPPAP